MDKLELFNAVARVARPLHREFTPVKALDNSLQDADLDSLDALLISVYLCMLYGIEDEKGKEIPFSTPQKIFDFLEEHKTRAPSSVAEAVELIK